MLALLFVGGCFLTSCSRKEVSAPTSPRPVQPQPAPKYPSTDPISDAISYAAYVMSEDLEPAAIVTPTRSGATARHISRYRPGPPIVALTPRRETQRQLCLTWGAIPILIPELRGSLSETALAWAKKSLHLKPGDRIIITAGAFPTVGTTNNLRLEKI